MSRTIATAPTIADAIMCGADFLCAASHAASERIVCLVLIPNAEFLERFPPWDALAKLYDKIVRRKLPIVRNKYPEGSMGFRFVRGYIGL